MPCATILSAALFDQLEAALTEVILSDAAITEAKIADGAMASDI